MKPRLKAQQSIPSLLILLMAMMCLVSLGCSAGKTRADTDIFLDEAFVALFPDISSRLIPEPADYPGSTLSELEATRQKATNQSALTPIIASPLVAIGLKGAEGRIVSPFLPATLASISGVKTVLYDYVSAYEALGSRAGKATARKAGKGGIALCAVVFQPNAMRGGESLEAFRKGYARFADPASLSVETLETAAASVDLAGSANAAIGKALSLKPVAIVLALDDFARTVAAASEMKNILRFGDVTTWREPASVSGVFEFWLEGNAKGIAASALKLLDAGAVVPNASYVALKRRARFPRIF